MFLFPGVCVFKKNGFLFVFGRGFVCFCFARDFVFFFFARDVVFLWVEGFFKGFFFSSYGVFSFQMVCFLFKGFFFSKGFFLKVFCQEKIQKEGGFHKKRLLY